MILDRWPPPAVASGPRSSKLAQAARTMVNGGFRQLLVADGTGPIGIVDIADACDALPGPPAA
jgi:hypothetical protein